MCFEATDYNVCYFKMYYVIISLNKTHTLSPQLQTVFEALENLAFSGPVKSKYPMTFLELNQVAINIIIALLCNFFCPVLHLIFFFL